MKRVFVKALSVFLSFSMILGFNAMCTGFQAASDATSSRIYTFEDSGDAGNLMGWTSDYHYTPMLYQVSENQHWMGVDVDFPTQTDGAVHVAPPSKMNDCQAIEYDVYIPDPSPLTGSLSIGTAIKHGDAWTWEDVGSSVNVSPSSLPTVKIGDTEYGIVHVGQSLSNIPVSDLADVQAVVLKLYSSTMTYSGSIYYDNVKLVASNDTTTPTGLLYNFNDGSLGFAGSSDPADAVTVDADNPVVMDSGRQAFQLDAAFDSSSTWSCGTIETTQFAGDWSAYNALQTRILIPDPESYTGGLKLQTVLKVGSGWTWTPVGLTGFTNAQIQSMPTETIRGTIYAVATVSQPFPSAVASSINEVKALDLQIAGDTSSYHGPLYIDDIDVVQGKNGPPPSSGIKPIKTENFDFENSADGTMGWAYGWGGDCSASSLSWSDDLAAPGNAGSLKLNLNVPAGTAWNEADIQVPLDGLDVDGTFKVDLTPYYSFDYDVYVPLADTSSVPADGQLKISTALNGVFQTVQDFQGFALKDMTQVTVNGKTYGKIHMSSVIGDTVNRKGSEALVLRFGGYDFPFNGPFYIDNIKLAYPSKFTVVPSNLSPEDVVSGVKNVIAFAFLPQGKKVDSIYMMDAGKTRFDFKTTDGANYACDWDTAKEPDGFQTITLNGTTTDGEQYSKAIEVYVKNAGTSVSITAPSEDATVKGTAVVSASVVNAKDASMKSVDLIVNGKTYSMTAGAENSYTVNLDTTKLKDGVHTLEVVAVDSQGYTVQANEEAMVNNTGEMTAVATRQGAKLILDGRQFNFNGTNMYDLPFLGDNTLVSNDKYTVYTEDGRAIDGLQLSGTTLSFKQRIDRSMDEMNKLGMTVLRTWAFNFNSQDTYAFVKTSESGWVNDKESFNEAEFARLDYILDSAARHNIRVILTLQNYWSDYGGIESVTDALGLSNKLKFFTDNAAKAYYKSYVDYITNRVNTVNGKAYKNDPAIFAWDLMNEARIDKADDGGDSTLDDPNGTKLAAWLNEMSSYVKSDDPNHLVTEGAEGHGFQFESDASAPHKIFRTADEGYGSDPIDVLNQPNIDFFSIHPYPNASEYGYSLGETKDLLTQYTKAGIAAGKPVVMEEFGVDSQGSLQDPNNKNDEVQPSDSSYANLRSLWNKEMLSTFRNAGGTGSLIWMMTTNATDPHYSIGVYTPSSIISRDRTVVSELADECRLQSSPATKNPGNPSITVSGNTATIVSPDAGSDIFYTIDGSVPELSSTLYTGPFTVPAGATVRAVVYLDGLVSNVSVVDPCARVQMYNAHTQSSTDSIMPRFKLYNTGSKPLDLSTVKIHYYFTEDGAQSENFWCDWSSVGNGNITSTFKKMSTMAAGADTCLEIGFTSGTGTLAPGESTEIHARFAKSDWSKYDQTDDYSFDRTDTNYTDWTKTPVYVAGVLSWGTEPQ